MAPWNVTWPFGDSNPDLPDSIAPAKGGSDSAFEVFIDGALTKIYNEASGRSKENRAIREACKAVLGEWACAFDQSSIGCVKVMMRRDGAAYITISSIHA